MNYRKDIQEIMEYLTHNNEEELKISYAELARRYNCDYRTIKNAINRIKNGAPKKKNNLSKSILDDYLNIIENKIETGAPITEIYKYIKKKGYKGSYSTVKNYVRKLHKAKQKAAVIRFETTPGLQAQVDWKESLKLTTKKGEIIKFNIFLITLGYSRYKFIKICETRDLRSVELSLCCAFKYFGGTPKEILFDNMRSIIDKARTQYSEPVYNEKFKQFAKDANFIPKACVAYRPCTKGKIEVVAKLMNRLKIYDGEIEKFEDIIKIASELLEEINSEVCQGTGKIPKELFKKEREYLFKTNLDNLTGYFEQPIFRKVSKESLITYEGNKYSLPPYYIGKEVEIHDLGVEFDVIFEGHWIKHWIKKKKKYNYDEDDYIKIMKSGSMKDLDDNEISNIARRNLKIYDEL